jgi:hypothetical protein
MTRQEHLAWCKQRALEYVKINDLGQAAASFISDMGKHDGTRSPIVAPLVMNEVLNGNKESMKRCIEGFN